MFGCAAEMFGCVGERFDCVGEGFNCVGEKFDRVGERFDCAGERFDCDDCCLIRHNRQLIKKNTCLGFLEVHAHVGHYGPSHLPRRPWFRFRILPRYFRELHLACDEDRMT